MIVATQQLVGQVADQELQSTHQAAAPGDPDQARAVVALAVHPAVLTRAEMGAPEVTPAVAMARTQVMGQMGRQDPGVKEFKQQAE